MSLFVNHDSPFVIGQMLKCLCGIDALSMKTVFIAQLLLGVDENSLCVCAKHVSSKPTLLQVLVGTDGEEGG